MTQEPNSTVRQLDTDDFVSIQMIHKDPEVPPAAETIRYDDFVRWLFKPGTEQVSALHWCNGIVGEFGEIAELVNEQIYDVDKLNSLFIEELGDVEFYFQAARNHYGLSLPYIDARKDPLEKFRTNGYLAESAFVYSLGLLSDVVKREYIYNKSREQEKVEEALAAINECLTVWYFCLNLHYTPKLHSLRADVLQANADKLAKRYVNLRYSDAAAINRADKKEN